MSRAAKARFTVVRKECPDVPSAPWGLRPKKCPRTRDRWAFSLYLDGLTQEEIAKEIGCSQASVCRAIKRVELWRLKVLPEERRELTALEEFHLACVRQQAHLARLQRTALADYEQSKQPVPMKKKITTTYKSGEAVDKVVERVEEWTRPGSPKASLLAAAQRIGTESTLLSGGCAGGKLMADDAIDHDEACRWDRAVKSGKEQIKKLEAELQGVKEQLAAAKVQAAAASAQPAAAQAKGAEAKKSEYAVCEKVSEIQAKVAEEHDATRDAIERCGEASASESPRENSAEKVNNWEGSGGGEVVPKLTRSASEGDVRLAPSPAGLENGSITIESFTKDSPSLALRVSEAAAGTANESRPQTVESKKYRWDDWHRQEALDYFCEIHNLPRAHLLLASGIPDPKNCTPKEAIERGYPYMIHIDRSEELEEQHRQLLRRRDAQRERERRY